MDLEGSHRFTRISKKLSYVLRHNALNEKGLIISTDGFVRLSALARLKILSYLKNPERHIVEFAKSEENIRFELIEVDCNEETPTKLIRARYGHSIPLEDIAPRKLERDEIRGAIHYTVPECVESIAENGLNRMKRLHIHLLGDLCFPTRIIKRHKYKTVAVHIDVQKAMSDGAVFYQFFENIVNTEGFDGVLPPKYILKIQQ